MTPKEKKYLSKVLDQLVSETKIDYDMRKIFPPFSFRPLTSVIHKPPFPSLPFFSSFSTFPNYGFVPFFEKHCKDMYGLTVYEVSYIWKQYISIIEDKIKNKPLNESTEDNALNKIVDQLVNETRIDYKYKVIHAPFNPHGDSSSFLFSSSPFSSPILLPSLSPPLLFFKYCKDIYGLTKQETEYVWYEYKKTIKNKINNKPLNESTEDNALNKIVDQLVGESKIDYEENVVYPPYPSTHAPYNLYPPYYYDTPDLFTIHCRDIYGLTEPEIEYVWEEYKQIITDKIHKPLNESIEDNALNKIVDQLVSETDIDYGTETVFAPTLLPSHPFSLFLFPPSTFLYSFLFFDHCRHMYGLTEKETQYVWDKYKKIIEYKIKNG